ncbi:MAG: hypothetical protein BGN92_00285 [Sphingobacteriales bacterium 41-5]|nr:MAG: hypothetical protein BGN92_00285 [Sphingobacteriales bacterium 41-5]
MNTQIIDKLPFPDLSFLFTFKSAWANDAIDINAPVTGSQWDNAGIYKFPNGLVMAKNDANFLYLVLDVISDTGNDPGDYFWLSFDNDKNRSITSNKDINYGLWPNQAPKLARQYYLGPGRWTGILNTPSTSAVKMEFGASKWSDTPHKIWKFKILLSEIGVNLAIPFFTPYSYFGFRLHSPLPNITYDFPVNFFNDFSKLKKLELSRKPVIANPDLGPVIGSVGLIPTTKITGGRATTASNYFVAVTNAAFGGTLNLIGNRTKMSSLFAAGNTKYKMEIKGPGQPAFSPLVSAWTNYVWNGTDYVLQSFSGTDGNYVLPNPALDFSIDDLLIQFPTTGLPNGVHTIKVTFFVGAGNTPADSQLLDLFIDNHLPVVNIEKIKHGANEVSTCAIEQLGPAPDGFTFEITASDVEGNLLGVSFVAQAGNGQSFNLYSESYDVSKGNWAGFINKVVPVSNAWRPAFQCSYNFSLTASARTTNGYGYIGYANSFKGLTVLV